MSGTLEAYQASVKGILAAGGVDPTKLVAAYSFWADSAGDHSGGGFNGTPVGSPTIANGAITLDGLDDAALLHNGTGINPTAALSLAAWIKTSVTGTVQYIFIKCNDLLTADDQFAYRMLADDNNTLQFDISQDGGFGNRNNGNITDFTGTSHICDGEWHHCVCTHNGANTYIYVDGVQENTRAMPINIFAANSRVTMGARWDASDVQYVLFFAGDITNALIWSRALTATEITALYNLGRI